MGGTIPGIQGDESTASKAMHEGYEEGKSKRKYIVNDHTEKYK